VDEFRAESADGITAINSAPIISPPMYDRIVKLINNHRKRLLRINIRKLDTSKEGNEE
jgi:hypothetical protein